MVRKFHIYDSLPLGNTYNIHIHAYIHTYIPTYIHTYIWVCLKIRRPAGEVWVGVWFGGMIRGMIREYDSEILNGPSAHLFAYMNLCKTSLNLLEKCCCQSFLCALEPACCWRCACCCQSGVRSLAGMLVPCRWVPLQGAGAGCCLLPQCWVQFGVGMLVPLQSAAAGAAWGCCCQSGVFVCVWKGWIDELPSSCYCSFWISTFTAGGAVNLIPSTAQRRRWFEIVISELIIPTYLHFWNSNRLSWVPACRFFGCVYFRSDYLDRYLSTSVQHSELGMAALWKPLGRAVFFFRTFYTVIPMNTSSRILFLGHYFLWFCMNGI